MSDIELMIEKIDQELTQLESRKNRLLELKENLINDPSSILGDKGKISIQITSECSFESF